MLKGLFASQALDSRIRSANTTNSEKWLGYFLGPVGAAVLNFTIISYLNVFYTDVLDLTNSFSWAVAFLALFPILSKIINAITNILMGQLIERTRTRQSKARPWLLISAPLMTVAVILLFIIPKEHSILQFALVALTYNIFFSFAYTIYNMSHTLMVPLSTSNVKQRDGLSLFSNMGGNMLSGLVVSLVFPAILMPMLGADYDKWVTAMSVLAVLALPLTVIEYYFTKERVTEAATSAGEQKQVSFREQIRVCFSSKYWIMLMIIRSAAKGKGVYKEDGSGRDDSSDKKVSGMNSTMFNLITNIVGTGMNRAANGKAADLATSPALDLLDVAGYNYASGRYPKEGQLHPDRLVVGSETFPQDIVKNWRMVEKYPWLCGDFMWTAWDYLGEVGLGTWAYTPDGKGFNKPYPWLLADSGAMDILGNPNGELFLAQAVWHTGKPVRIAVQPVNHPGVKPAKAVWRGTNALPSWSWQGCEGYPAVVEVYADAAWVELSLNGKPIERKKLKDCKVTFKLKYAPGKLSAIAYDEHDQPVGDDELISATGEIMPVIITGNRP